MEATKQGNWEPLQRYLATLDTITFREYQETIGTLAASRNTLVILPTALGKTIIALKAAMLRFQRYPWGKVVFLAPRNTGKHVIAIARGTGMSPAFERFLHDMIASVDDAVDATGWNMDLITTTTRDSLKEVVAGAVSRHGLH